MQLKPLPQQLECKADQGSNPEGPPVSIDESLINRLSDPDATARTEADIQSDIKLLLTTGEFDVDSPRLEEQVGDGSRRRIDIAAGATVIEVKKKLTNLDADSGYIDQLSGYVRTRMQQEQTRYNGILTDGRTWWLFETSPSADHFDLRSSFELVSDKRSQALVEWLQAVLATRSNLKPTQHNIETLLGAASPAYDQDSAYLSSLYEQVRHNPMVKLKRQLWARLLRSALGTGFVDDDKLFIDHTLLVVEASAIGHAVMGLNIIDLLNNPQGLLDGYRFRQAGIYNVIEPGFFDWILMSDEGERFLAHTVRRIAMFDWIEIEHDALKILYESVINADVRKGMGEYYTPDWLAEGVTRKTISAPLSQRILDPACGSGTFLFQAIRLITSEAEAAGWDSSTIVEHVQAHVFGLDIHPVSVMLGRVTYLLALGKHLEDRGDLWVPVHLGDSMQWYQPDDHDENIVRIDTEGPDLTTAEHTTLFSLARTLVFPLTSIDDTDTFDQLVSAMTNRAKEYTDKSRSRPKIEPILKRFGITTTHESASTLIDTFNLLCDLNAEGKDSIWGFYVRNQVRPLWLSMPNRRADVLIGNPPWVAYRYMTSDLQKKYKAFAKKYWLWEGGNVAPQQDLVALFTARAVDKYLNDEGVFGFVTPYSVLSRRAYDGFRKGKWGAHLRAHFTELWDLHELKPNDFFPVPAATVFGRRSVKPMADSPEPPHGFPKTKRVYSGKFAKYSWSLLEQQALITEETNVSIGRDTVASSPYNESVVNGATIFPKVLTFIREVEQSNSKLGQRAGMTSFESLPSVHKPWKTIPPLAAALPNEFIFEVHQGSTVLPFRSLKPSRAVLPILNQTLLTEEEIDSGDDQFRRWWKMANSLWEQYKTSQSKLSFRDNLNMHNKLNRQLTPTKHRVFYTTSGNTLAAVRNSNPTQLVEQKLLWIPSGGINEARYLTAVLNAPITTKLVSIYQSDGLMGPRDFTKYVWMLPIPRFSADLKEHQELVAMAEKSETIASKIDFGSYGFQKCRSLVREELDSEGILSKLDNLVDVLLSRSGPDGGVV